MTDTEKVALIDKMIADFWEASTDNAIARGADAVINAIASVLNFGGVDDGKT